MSSFKTNEVAINLELFKTLRIFHLFNPNGPKIFNFNAYRLASVLVSAFALCILIYGSFGLVVGTELKNNMDALSKSQFMFTYVMFFQVVFKISTITYHAHAFWDLLQLTRLTFLESKKCSKHIGKLYSYRKSSIILTKFFAQSAFGIICMWCIFPLVINAYNIISSDKSILRYENIFNLTYPLTLSAYNQYYFIFFFMECILNVFCGYIILGTNVIFVSFFLVIIPQYEIIYMAFENLGHEHAFENGNKSDITQYYDDFISILEDQRRLYIKLQKFYSILKPIAHITVIIGSSALIFYCVPVAEFYFEPLSKGPSTLLIFKIIFSLIYLLIELFVYCYLLDDINTKKESVSFGMYCCNWTEMNLRFKKLLLLSMRMNDANQLKIKITHSRAVNVMLFSSVMSTTYNIISFLINTLL